MASIVKLILAFASMVLASASAEDHGLLTVAQHRVEALDEFDSKSNPIVMCNNDDVECQRKQQICQFVWQTLEMSPTDTTHDVAKRLYDMDEEDVPNFITQILSVLNPQDIQSVVLDILKSLSVSQSLKVLQTTDVDTKMLVESLMQVDLTQVLNVLFSTMKSDPSSSWVLPVAQVLGVHEYLPAMESQDLASLASATAAKLPPNKLPAIAEQVAAVVDPNFIPSLLNQLEDNTHVKDLVKSLMQSQAQNMPIESLVADVLTILKPAQIAGGLVSLLGSLECQA